MPSRCIRTIRGGTLKERKQPPNTPRSAAQMNCIVVTAIAHECGARLERRRLEEAVQHALAPNHATIETTSLSRTHDDPDIEAAQNNYLHTVILKRRRIDICVYNRP